MPGTQIVTPAGQQLGLTGGKTQFGLDFALAVHEPQLAATSATVTVEYPSTLNTLPSVDLTVGGTTLRAATATWDRSMPKLSDVYATFAFSSAVKGALHFGDTVTVTVSNVAGTVLASARFAVPDSAAFRQTFVAAVKDLKQQCASGEYDLG